MRELCREQPVLEWLYGRLIVTETALGDLAREAPAHAGACDRVLSGNGYAAKADAASILFEAQLAALSEAAGVVDTEKPALLLADRDPLLLRALRRVLERRYRVFIATTADAALLQLAEHAIDVIVTDQDLGQADGGVWLLERARASFPQVGRILVAEQPLTDVSGAGESVEHWVRKGARLQVLLERVARSLARG